MTFLVGHCYFLSTLLCHILLDGEDDGHPDLDTGLERHEVNE